VTSLTNTAGTITQKYDYDAFGNLRDIAGYSSDNDANPFRYCGEYFDEETGTIYLRARYYNPAIGRFTQEDVYRGTPDNPLSLNLYTYSWNNPITYSDPTGNNPAVAVEQFLYSPAGQGLLQQLQTLANQAGVTIETFIANNLPMIQQLIGHVGQFGSAAYDYFSSGQAWDDVKSGADGVKKWFEDTFGGGASPGGPEWNGGFNSFHRLKKYLGSPGVGNQWHHIVEQSQIGKSNFAKDLIHNVNNVTSISKDVHEQITAYYNTTTFDFTGGLSVRNWLAGQSFEVQYQFGLEVLEKFGVII
jgi:RHS repeat-associated core domain